MSRFHKQQEAKKQSELNNNNDDDDDDNEELKHSDSYERSGRIDPDEDLLGNGEYSEDHNGEGLLLGDLNDDR